MGKSMRRSVISVLTAVAMMLLMMPAAAFAAASSTSGAAGTPSLDLTCTVGDSYVTTIPTEAVGGTGYSFESVSSSDPKVLSVSGPRATHSQADNVIVRSVYEYSLYARTPGVATIKATFTKGEDVVTKQFTATVEKIKVYPEYLDNALVYTGNVVEYPERYPYVVVGGEKTATEIGTHSVKLALSDKDNMVWSDNTNDAKTVQYRVVSNISDAFELSQAVYVHDGTEKKPTSSSVVNGYVPVSFSYRDNVDAGIATVEITALHYANGGTGRFTKYFSIIDEDMAGGGILSDPARQLAFDQNLLASVGNLELTVFGDKPASTSSLPKGPIYSQPSFNTCISVSKEGLVSVSGWSSPGKTYKTSVSATGPYGRASKAITIKVNVVKDPSTVPSASGTATGKVAMDGKTYASLVDALEECARTEEEAEEPVFSITLLEDVAIQSKVTYTGRSEFDIDLNGHRLLSDLSGTALEVPWLVVMDSSSGESGRFSCVFSTGWVVFEGGTFEGRAVQYREKRHSTISGGTFAAGSLQNLSQVFSGLTIQGGTFVENPSAYIGENRAVLTPADTGTGMYKVVTLREYAEFLKGKLGASSSSGGSTGSGTASGASAAELAAVKKAAEAAEAEVASLKALIAEMQERSDKQTGLIEAMVEQIAAMQNEAAVSQVEGTSKTIRKGTSKKIKLKSLTSASGQAVKYSKANKAGGGAISVSKSGTIKVAGSLKRGTYKISVKAECGQAAKKVIVIVKIV